MDLRKYACILARSRFQTVSGREEIVANCFRPAGSAGTDSVQIERVALQRLQRDVLEDVLVRGFEDHLWRHAGLVGLDPAQHVKAPAVPGCEALEAHLRARRGEIVAARAAELEKLRGRLDAHQVRDPVRVVRRAAAVAEKAGERRVAAGEQRTPEDVFFLGEDGAHEGILAGNPSLGGHLRNFSRYSRSRASCTNAIVVRAAFRARSVPSARASRTSPILAAKRARRSRIGSRKVLSAVASFCFTSTSPTEPRRYRSLRSATSSRSGLKTSWYRNTGLPSTWPGSDARSRVGSVYIERTFSFTTAGGSLR